MFYPCHKKKKKKKNKKKKNKNPSPKFISGGCTRRLKFDAWTTYGLLAKFRGLGVQVTREQNLLDPKIFQTQIFFGPKIFLDPKIFWTHNFFGPKFFFGPKIFLDPKLFQAQIFFQTQSDVLREKTKLLNFKLSKLAKG